MYIWYFIDVQYSFRDSKKYTNYNGVFHKKKFKKLIDALAVQHAKKKNRDWILLFYF